MRKACLARDPRRALIASKADFLGVSQRPHSELASGRELALALHWFDEPSIKSQAIPKKEE
jgi:hypothetical protein